MTIVIYLLFGIVFGVIGTAMSENRGRSAAGGFFLGLLLGLIGLAIIAILGNAPKTEPELIAKKEEEGILPDGN